MLSCVDSAPLCHWNDLDLQSINDDVVMRAIQTIHVWFPNWIISFREDLQGKDAIKVIPKVVLNVVLAEMGLPDAKYRTYVCHRGLKGVTVYFWQSSEPIKIHGEPAADVNKAMQSAAIECLRYLAGTMESEFDCPQVKKMKDEMGRLSRNIDDKDREIKTLKRKLDKDLQVRSLSKGWGSFANDILDSGNRIGKIAVNYLPSGSSATVGDVTWDFCGIIQEVENLDHLSMMATDVVQTIGISL